MKCLLSSWLSIGLLGLSLGDASAHAEERVRRGVSEINDLVVDEELLTKLFIEDSVARDLADANIQRAQFENSQFREKFQTELYARANHEDSNEKALFEFAPVFGPAHNAQFGVRKNFALGVSAEIETFSVQLSTNDRFIYEATQVGARVNFAVDLWKNFMGRLDRAGLIANEVKSRRIEIESELQKIASLIDIRKMYWSWVATEESLKLAKELIQTAEQQLKDARVRFKASAGDRGEVARYEAQLESRRGSLLLFELQRETLISMLRQQIPSLNEYRLTIAPVRVDRAQKSYDQCAQSIIDLVEFNEKSTFIPIVIEMLRLEYLENRRQAERYSKMDLQLIGRAQTTGTGQSYPGAERDFLNERRQGYAVGIQVTVPLDGTQENSEKKLLAAQKAAYEAQSRKLETQLVATHQEARRNLLTVSEALRRQSDKSKYLLINLEEMRKKFNQGRVSVSNLIFEQDTYFQSMIQEIDLKLQAVHALYDYFKLFPKHPCPMNQTLPEKMALQKDVAR